MPESITRTTSSSVNENPVSYKHFIHIKGARSNNLQNIEIFIPKNKLVVVTGVSGSGKSSLVIDTLYSEGQRRYVESLSSYARQFLDRMKKPEVDFIKGICPAIAIEQKVSTGNARSTVGSLTEIYDYLRLLYARIGKTYSPVSGKEVKKQEVRDVVDFISSCDEGEKFLLLIPLALRHNRNLGFELDLLLQKGYNRIYVNEKIVDIQQYMEENDRLMSESTLSVGQKLFVVIDRFVVNAEEENLKRIADSVLTAFAESEGDCVLFLPETKKYIPFNNRFELDGITFLEPNHQLFNYNNPYGACPKCEGYGKMIGIDRNRVIPDESLSVYQGAIYPWRGERGSYYQNQLIANASRCDFPIHKPYQQLTEDQQELLWNGNNWFNGIYSYFQELEEASYKIQNRVILSRYRGKTTCDTCKGGRLRPEAMYVKVAGKNLPSLINIPIEELYPFFEELALSEHDTKIAERILYEVKLRLEVMIRMGLGYLTLDRHANTLSGGETQRINLTRTLGSNLINSMYILDEPSVGLHPRDTEKLVQVLKNLRDLGNTVIVIEHEEAIIRNADYLIDVGPLAGVHGGHIVFEGDYQSLYNKVTDNLTGDYLKGIRQIKPLPQKRKIVQKIFIEGALEHNLKNINVTIPLQALTVICGVSGSGKTTLVQKILYPGLKILLNEPLGILPGRHKGISGDIKNIQMVEFVGQSPLGKSSRSNPVTYVKAYDGIRKLFSDQQLSKIKGFEPKHFSFNVEGGRCENCKGDGEITVEMQFLADVTLLCDECQGKRFKKEVLEVEVNGKNIFDVLNLTVEESLTFFAGKKDIITRLQPLADVGLGYIKLGQASSTLSGGEAQRLKLASFMTKEFISKKIFFIFDEPTTGLHFYDVEILMKAFQTLVETGHTVVIVEHNLDVIKCADHVIELGPEGGKAGGHLVFEGHPEGLEKEKNSVTGKYMGSGK
ncbi:MAG: excinuclease ABC subunit UvrA [Saprospiraceae bacterium]|nr:excinuclease ABC subunit UvrA [Saprospiraceae bacterium]MBK7524772.1 excinuclease ABC subunit UvrA [Saprospiraceae bacterium]MBK8549452.1 excinuclease ABC subunit UvrA [Saprospiraceae bacterium]MBK9043998.1 excinuclease ABC subunit UvrA [Saprospiraceae bacterium]